MRQSPGDNSSVEHFSFVCSFGLFALVRNCEVAACFLSGAHKIYKYSGGDELIRRHHPILFRLFSPQFQSFGLFSLLFFSANRNPKEKNRQKPKWIHIWAWQYTKQHCGKVLCWLAFSCFFVFLYASNKIVAMMPRQWLRKFAKNC